MDIVRLMISTTPVFANMDAPIHDFEDPVLYMSAHDAKLTATYELFDLQYVIKS